MTDPHVSLIRSLQRVGQGLTSHVTAGSASVADWEEALQQALAEHHLALYAAGARLPVEALTPQDLRVVSSFVQKQMEYLQGFGNDIESGRYLENARLAAVRAAMYGSAGNASWWMGRTRGYVLPAYPGDGTTQCRTNCKCSWEISPLDGEGNADAYWRMGHAEHCQTCAVRAEEWAPLHIRGGEIQYKEWRGHSHLVLKAKEGEIADPRGQAGKFQWRGQDVVWSRPLTTKGWVTIHGHPVNIGGAGEGGGGGHAASGNGTVEEAQQWGEEHFGQWADSLPPKLKAAVTDYTDQGYRQVNPALRWNVKNTAATQKKVAALDKALEGQKLPETVTVHRGYNDPKIRMAMERGDDLSGMTFTDKGYVSTSMVKDAAFSDVSTLRSMQTHITLPKGSPGAYVGKISKFPSQGEILLPRNSKFRITSYTREGNAWNVQMEYVGQGEGD